MATDEQPGATEPTSCPPCRGTGRVISNLGGEPHEQECPWCEGSGTFQPGHDAQAHWRSEGSEDSAA